MNNASRAVGYVRRSTGKQDNSIEVQGRAIAAWCHARGIELAAVFIDSVSRTTPVHARPGLVSCLASTRELDAGIVVVQKRDRMSDGAVIADAFERAAKSNGALVKDTEGASEEEGVSGVINRGMRDLMSQVEIAQIRARTTAALAIKKARGERVGTVPFGYRVSGDGVRIEPEPKEGAIVATARKMRSEGHTVRAIVEDLEALDMMNRKGRPFGVAAVHAMLSGAERTTN